MNIVFVVKCLLEDFTYVLPERYNHCDETWEVAFAFLEVGIGRGGEKVGEAQGRGRKSGGMEGELAEELRDQLLEGNQDDHPLQNSFFFFF